MPADSRTMEEEVVEIMARAIAGTVEFSWPHLSEVMREHYVTRARKYVNALRAAGYSITRSEP